MKKRTIILISGYMVFICISIVLIIHARNWYKTTSEILIQTIDTKLAEKDTQISNLKSEILHQSEQMNALKIELDTLIKTDIKKYNEKVNIFNDIANAHNKKVDELNIVQDDFLAEVDRRNSVAEELNKKIFIVEYFRSFSHTEKKE